MDLKAKSLLITGGTGSFGKAFTRHLLTHSEVRRIIIYSRDEYKQFLMREEFKVYDDRMRYFIGDIRDENRLRRALNGVDYVVHAAALKQVPSCEYNPIEAIKTNINGAMNLINASLDSSSVKKVIALSTDKAVNPINLYGGTKLVSDKLFTSANNYAGHHDCRFSVVRYGNVAGSRGSVIPFFRELIVSGKKILPLTDEQMTRFWMTLDSAVELVLNAFELSKGGEIFVLKNHSFFIKDLILAINPNEKYEVTGIREGEKLHECMITSSDSRTAYEYGNHYVIYPQYDWWNKNPNIIDGGKKVPANWEYMSNNNSEWLSVDQLKRALEKL